MKHIPRVVRFCALPLLFGTSGAFAAAPANDDFATPRSLGSALDVVVDGTWEEATPEWDGGEPDLVDDWMWSEDATVWYVWTAPAGATWAQATHSGLNVPTRLTVYTGNDLGSLTRVSQNDRETDEGNRTTFPVTGGQQYRIRLLVPGWAVWEMSWDELPEYEFQLRLKGATTVATAAERKLRGRGRLETGTPAAAVAARDDFAAAVSLDPADHEARFLLALSQLMALEGETGFLNLLQEIGVSPGGSLRGGGYEIGETPDGYPALADGADTGAVFDWLAGEVLPRLAVVRSSLSEVSGTDFRTDLTEAETGGVDFAADTGDALVLKAGTHALEMFVQLLTTYNLAVPLGGLIELDREGELEAERVLEVYSSLLDFSATDRREDLADSLRALESDYLAASEFIRNQRTEAHGLLTESLGEDPESDEEVRGTLADAVAALDGEIMLGNTRMNLSAFLSAGASPRSWLPPLKGGKVNGAFPDPTFGGMFPGSTAASLRSRMYEVGMLFGMSQYSGQVGDYLGFLGLSAGPDDDADGDGTSNFAEWIFGSDPATPSVVYQEILPAVEAEGGEREVRFSFIRAIDPGEWRLVVLVSDDLAVWDDTEAQVEQVGDAAPTGDGISEIATYRFAAPAAAQDKKFFRVEARPAL